MIRWLGDWSWVSGLGQQISYLDYACCGQRLDLLGFCENCSGRMAVTKGLACVWDGAAEDFQPSLGQIDDPIVADAGTGRELFVLPTGACKVYCLALLPDGRLAAGGSDNCIHVWDLERREATARLTGHTGTVAGMAVEGDELYSVGYDTTLRIWTTQPLPAIAERPTEPRVGLRPETGGQ